jgi:TonB family protein
MLFAGILLMAIQVAADCSMALGGGVSSAAGEICLGEQQVKLAAAETKSSFERRRLLELAADHYERAASVAVDRKLKVAALDTLTRLFDVDHLNVPVRIEAALKELIRLEPDNLRYLYRLSRVQEDQGFIDAAQDTLLSARHREPDSAEPNMMLLQFYTRRLEALGKPMEKTGGAHVYRVGGGIPQPRRLDGSMPVYPDRAKAAGATGIVLVELIVNESGFIADARVLRSVPLLDEPALEAVRKWRFAPTLINGRPVPVSLTTSVSFTPPK